MTLFAPDKYIKDFRSVDFLALKNKGIKLIVCDLDNTLAAYDETRPNADVKTFVENVQQADFQLCLLSNNVAQRVDTFAQELGIKTYPMAKKPLKTAYLKILEDYQWKPCQVAVIGDQLLTDVLGGNRVGMYTILTMPLYERDLIWTKCNRMIENMVFAHLERRGYLKKGECDE